MNSKFKYGINGKNQLGSINDDCIEEVSEENYGCNSSYDSSNDSKEVKLIKKPLQENIEVKNSQTNGYVDKILKSKNKENYAAHPR